MVSEVRDGLVHYLGHGLVESAGMRKGAVVNLEAATESIKRAAEQAERSSGVPVERVFMSLGGAHVRGLASQAGISLASRSREITREDTRRVLELARAIPVPDDREILHVLPQDYILDNQPGFHDPIGMLASRLETRVYIVTVATGAKQNLVVAANQAGLEVEELIFTPLAVAEASLRTEDRSLGVAVIEVGGGCTGLAVFSQNAVTHAGVIPVGGDHFTNDIAIAFNTPHREAEKIKCAFGFAAASYVQAGSQIEVPSVGDRAARMLPHRELCECIEPRAQELVRLIQEDLRRAGVLGTLGAGVLLSGGGSRLAGFPEMMESLLGLPVRPVAPALIQEMPDKLGDPEFAFALGATYYGHRVRARRARPKSAWQKAVEQLKRLAAD